MSLRKNISGGPLDVPLLDRTVGDGETVEVPDYQPGHDEKTNPLPIVWPENRWEPVDQSVTPEKAAKTSSDTAGA